MVAIALAVVLAVPVVAWFAARVREAICECPYDCPEHPTEGTAQ